MNYQIDFDEEIFQLLRHLSPERKTKIKESLRTISRNPSLGKALQENLLGLLSYRVGRFRIVYSLDSVHKRIHVIAIGPRAYIYKDLEKKIQTRKNSRRSTK